jgi:hypothetical protein
MEFRATVVLGGKTATGIQVPDEIVEALGSGKRPPVVVTLGGYSYRTTVAPMSGAFWIPLAAEHREAAGVQADQAVDVSIELDTAPREVPLPDDLAAAFDDDVRTNFDGLAFRTARSGCAGSRRQRSPRPGPRGSRRRWSRCGRGRRPGNHA